MSAYLDLIRSKLVAKLDAGFDPEGISPHLFPFQEALVRWACRMGRCAVFADCGLGKGHPHGTRILTPVGWAPIENLRVGQQVIGGDGKPCLLTGHFPKAYLKIYRVHFSDGTSVMCDADHLWSVKSYNDVARGKPWRVRSTSQLVASQLKYGTHGQSRTWQIPLVGAIEFPEQSLPVDPYVLGVMLGDGYLRGTLTWTKPDEDLAQEVARRLPAGLSVRLSGDGPGRSIVSEKAANPYLDAFREMGLMDRKSRFKFVPEDYLFASPAQRLDLLRGLMDTDGYCGEPTPEFSSASPELASAVVFLVQSLGGVAFADVKEEPVYTHNGERRIGQPSHRVTMTLPPGVNPFLTPCKADKYFPASRGLGRWIDTIVLEDYAPSICLSVDNPDQLYVTEHCIVTHNTRVQLAWAEAVANRLGGPVLIYAPLTVAKQTLREASAMGMEVRLAKDGSEVGEEGVWIANYERHHRFADLGEVLSGIVLDESSILKSVDGKTRNALLSDYDCVPYKLCCTATPAPNDITEIANHAEFLGVKTRTEMLAHWFVHDDEGWRLKGHASADFYRWLATWSCYLRTPADIGFDGSSYVLPELDIRQVVVEADLVPDGFLLPVAHVTGIVGRSELRRATLALRVEAAAQLVEAEPLQSWILWTGLNDESDALAKRLKHLPLVQVEGSTSEDDKVSRLDDFISGRASILVTKIKVAGFGLNLQHCSRQIFVGIGDSWEGYYQALRRSYRFGQVNTVRAYIVTSDAEQGILENVLRKEREAVTMGDSIIANIADLEREALKGPVMVDIPLGHTETRIGNGWTLHNGDCVEVLRDEIATDSVDLSVYSPPFATLYTYSDNPRDMGNCVDHAQFFTQFQHFVEQMLRVTKPGRATCVHVAQLSSTLAAHGRIGLIDFRGAVIAAYQQAGWVYHGECCINKDPQAQAIRTHSKALLFVQFDKDRSHSRPAIADYILVFKKPGENQVPIRGGISREEWIEWAHPVWNGIRETHTLNAAEARSEKDERHICPLQIGVIDRCVKLWSNPGELILSPFAGIGSEGFGALKAGRRFVGVELKPEYFKVACSNLRKGEATEGDLFTDAV